MGFDVARCIELLGIPADALSLAGAGRTPRCGGRSSRATTARPWARRRHDDAASVGARLLVAEALDEGLELDTVNPVLTTGGADPGLVAAYRAVRPASDAAARGGARCDPSGLDRLK